MRTLDLLLAMPLAFSYGIGVAAAQPAGVITQGSPDTMIGGKPAARVGDGTAGGAPVVEGSRDVFNQRAPGRDRRRKKRLWRRRGRRIVECVHQRQAGSLTSSNCKGR